MRMRESSPKKLIACSGGGGGGMGQGRKLSPDEMDDNEHETDFSIPKYVYTICLGSNVEYSVGAHPIPTNASAILSDIAIDYIER